MAISSPKLHRLSQDCFAPAEDGWNDVRGMLLAICLWHNDCVSLIELDQLLDTVKPLSEVLQTRSIETGDYGSKRTYLDRLYTSTLRELLYLIEKNDKGGVLRSDKWFSIEEGLPEKTKSRWKSLKQIANGELVREEIQIPLVKIRGAIGFHYEPRAVLKGYEYHLQNQTIPSWSQIAYVKPATENSRLKFYFADAAAKGLLTSILGIVEKETPWPEFLAHLQNVAADLFVSFMKIKKTTLSVVT